MRKLANPTLLDPLLYLRVLLEGEGEHSELVVQAAARHRVATGRVGAAHHPGGRQRQSVLFVGRKRILIQQP